MQKPFWQLGNLYTGKELVMGLPSATVFGQGEWQGLLMDEQRAQALVSTLEQQAEWRPRLEAEEDDDWQQIYPYALFKCGNLYAEYKRGTKNTSDNRLNLKYTLAIGGHVFKPEFEQTKTITNWIQQIFHQDVQYEGNITPHCIGILNDNADDLGKYHLGIIYVLEGDTTDIRSKIHDEVRLLKLQDFTNEDIEFLERWSQMIYRQLRDKEVASQNGIASDKPQHFHVSQLMGN